MKTLCFMNYRTIILIWGFLVINQLTGAQMFEDKWETERTFKATRSYSVTVNNKYGSVMVSTWDKDSVKISVLRKITERSAEKLKRLVESIDISFREGQGQVWVESVLGSRHTTFIQDVKEAGNFSNARPSTEIDYQIMVPPDVHLEITNKYGDIVLPSLSGHVKIDLSNGNLQARNLSGLAEMNLAFGNAELGTIRQGNIFLNFVNFICEDSEFLTIDGRSSEIKVKDADHFKISSRRDRIYLANIKFLEAETYFSNLNCLNLQEYGKLKMTYGRLEKLCIAAGYKGLDIISQTCDVNLQFITPTPYSALIRANRTVDIPVELKTENSNYREIIAEQPVRFTFRKKMPDDKIKVNILDGELKIDHR